MITSADRRLPDDLAARARTYTERGTSPVPPRDAATIALLRDAADAVGGVEVYVLRRVPTMAFASGMHVFPGGTVDQRDLAYDTNWIGPPPSAWAERFGVVESRAQGLVLAAVRETFEESGILLAGHQRDHVVTDPSDAGWEADRLALIERSLSFAEMLE